MLKKLTVSAGALMMLALASGPVLADGKFGAIATSEHYFGISKNMDSKDSAQKDAMDTCRNNDKKEPCTVAVWFTHCGATAEDDKSIAWGIGDSKSEAIAAAKKALGGEPTSEPVGECNDD
jgi:hypothetical protein